MIDSHTHLALCEEPPATVWAAARAVGVNRALTVGIDERTNLEALKAASELDGVWAAVGRHPNGATGFDDAAVAEIERLAALEEVAAVGESGFDFYRDRASRRDQEVAFRAQIEIARRVGKPLVIHMRDSVAETFELLAAEAGSVRVILHCFSASPEWTAQAAAHGWYCSFAGNLTYPKAEQLREAARLVPDELLLVETDAPFLSPQPMRGKPNSPANVVTTAERLAEERGVSYVELERLVEANAARLFGW